MIHGNNGQTAFNIVLTAFIKNLSLVHWVNFRLSPRTKKIDKNVCVVSWALQCVDNIVVI